MNENNIELIESYLTGNMTPQERERFEKKITEDTALSTLFSIYKTIDTDMYNKQQYETQEAALKTSLNNLNTKYFKAEAPVVSLNPQKRILRTVMSAAAGLILILVAYLAFFKNNGSVTQLADAYVKTELQKNLSLTMDGARDSLQQGLAAYNAKDYGKALQIFDAIYGRDSQMNDALKYSGIVYLVTKDYDNALKRFDTLAQKKELFSNAGIFLKAVTLLQRNKPGDQGEAKILLQQVVKEKAQGSKEAEEWLEKY
jgi:anti-sigma-K factor RskA